MFIISVSKNGWMFELVFHQGWVVYFLVSPAVSTSWTTAVNVRYILLSTMPDEPCFAVKLVIPNYVNPVEFAW